MKKIIFGLICFMCSGCAFTTTMVGDVTTYTPNGEILQKWDQVILQETVSYGYGLLGGYTTINAFKTFGINFYDGKSGKYIFVGNSVPCIIEYRTESSYNSPNIDYISEVNKPVEGAQVRGDQYKNELINQWKNLSAKEQAIKSLMKETAQNSAAYKNLKYQRKEIITQMDKVGDKLWNLFGYDIHAKYNR